MDKTLIWFEVRAKAAARALCQRGEPWLSDGCLEASARKLLGHRSNLLLTIAFCRNGLKINWWFTTVKKVKQNKKNKDTLSCQIFNQLTSELFANQSTQGKRITSSKLGKTLHPKFHINTHILYSFTIQKFNSVQVCIMICHCHASVILSEQCVNVMQICCNLKVRGSTK